VLVRFDPASDAPLFAQLAASMRSEIARGAYAPGDRLPSGRELADALGINLHTVLRAYQELRDDGVLELRRGRGAVVRQGADATAPLLPAVSALVADARRRGVGAATLIALIREEYRS
jgi:GntR family transcriptional regulator